MCDFISNYILTSDGLKTALQVTTGVIDPDGNDRKVTDRFVVDITRPYDIAVAIDALTVKVALENGLEASFKEDHLLMTNSEYKSTKKVFSEIQARSVGELPIKLISPEEQSIFIAIVDRIINEKKGNNDTSMGEREIDRLVYHLYGLTYDEVLIVDPQTPITREEYEN